MWVLTDVTGEEPFLIFRWMFLFAAPHIFEIFSSVAFQGMSFIYLFASLTALLISSLLGSQLTQFVTTLNTDLWAKYGKMLSFAGHVILITHILIQVWVGFVLADIFKTFFSQTSNILSFYGFTLIVVFLCCALKTAYTDVAMLR